MSATASPRRLIVVLGTLAALLAAGYGSMFSLLGEYRDQYGISEGLLGLVIGVGFLSGFSSQVLVAPLADRGQARRVVVGGSLVYVIGMVVLGVATTFWPMVLGRFVMGLGVGAAGPAMRRLVIVASPERLGHNLGTLLALEVGGFAAGPAVALALAGPFGLAAPFLVIAAVACVAMVFAARLNVAEQRHEAGPRLAFDLLRVRPFAAATTLAAVVYLMIGAFDALWSVSMKDLAAAPWLNSLGITLFALPLVLLGPYGGRLAQRVGPFRVALGGLTIATVLMGAYGLMPTAGWMFALAMVHALSDGVSVSASSVAAGMVVAEDRQAGAQGMSGAAQTLAGGIAASVIGAVYEHFGRTVAYLTAGAMMAVTLAAGAWLAWPWRRLRGSDAPPHSPAG